ncbi:MAG: diguanylate cyclase [Ignavibacteriales bacterium]
MIDSKKGQNIISSLLAIFSTIGLLQFALSYETFYLEKYYYLYAYIGLLLVSAAGLLLKKYFAKKPFIFYVIRFIELHFIFLLIIISSKGLGANIVNILMLTTLFNITAIVKGDKAPYTILAFALVNFVADIAICFFFSISNCSLMNIIVYLLDLIGLTVFALYAHFVILSYGKTFWELEQTHIETTKTNQLLNDSVAELSTLQEISKFSNSVLNIKELINLINDMIIGVIGVNYCSIFLIDETDKFYMEATNVSDKNTLQSLKLILSSKYLPQIKARGLTSIEENINELKDYPISNDRNIKNSLIACLQSHRTFLGVILAETCFDGVFEERKKNMITTICNQVSIAIENAVIYDKMEKLATIDGLTQVHNRRYFNEVFLTEFSDLKKNSAVSVAMMDIDNFKKINDTYGHLVGDAVLKNVASIIKNTICASDSDDYLVARYGGEEFVILFRNTELETAMTMLEVVRKNIESSSVDDDDQKVKFTISIGAAEYPKTSSDVKQILRDADNALYKAKQTGKNKVVAADIL